jgi:hypothetical protein
MVTDNMVIINSLYNNQKQRWWCWHNQRHTQNIWWWIKSSISKI